MEEAHVLVQVEEVIIYLYLTLMRLPLKYLCPILDFAVQTH